MNHLSSDGLPMSPRGLPMSPRGLTAGSTFCVILTHRHGAGIGIVKHNPSWLKSDFFQTAQAYCAQKNSLLQTERNFEFVCKKNSFIFARVLGKTAENLSNLFQFSCDMFGLEQTPSSNQTATQHTHSIQNLIVGTGPGSFTGLRLGCAFANGLNLGSDSTTHLFSISTNLVHDLQNELQSNHDMCKILFDELGTFHQTDPSSGYVTFFDLLRALHQISENKMVPCTTLLPNYGREPSPVLNLRKE